MELPHILRLMFVAYLAIIGVALFQAAFQPTAYTPQPKLEVAK